MSGDDADSELRRVRAALARGAPLEEALEEETSAVARRGELRRLEERVVADMEGAGPRIQPLLQRGDVTDVLVAAGKIWIDAGGGLEFLEGGMSESEVRALAVRMAASCSRRLDDASPIVDATLSDGTRLNAVLPPLSADGTLISLRTKKRTAMTIEDLIRAGSLDGAVADVLRSLIEVKASCVISGATGTGKTTLLAALLGLVSHGERIVCIEEASELQPTHPHVIHLQERGANVQGVGAVHMTELVRAALRMRPDRIVLGECRGPEVRDVLTALNTGHEGGWATLHANSVDDVPARLTALGALAGMNDETVAAQAVSALNAVIHIRRVRTESGSCRVVDSIGVFDRNHDRQLRCVPAIKRIPESGSRARQLVEGSGQGRERECMKEQGAPSRRRRQRDVDGEHVAAMSYQAGPALNRLEDLLGISLAHFAAVPQRMDACRRT